jgi:hypothetical protein
MFFMMSLCFGFLGLILPWSSAYFRTLSVGTSMYNKMGHPLSFWQSSFFALIFRQAPCRSWIITQANTSQGNILNWVQAVGFLALFILVSVWLGFLWANRTVLTDSQKHFLLKTSLLLFVAGALITVRMATFADCSLIQSIELLDVQFSWKALFLPTFAAFFGLLAIATSRRVSKEVESA